MKNIVLGLFVLVMVACSSEPFKGNVDNELLVGSWTVSEVDDAGALVSKEEFIITAMHEKYKVGHVLSFEKGPKFSLKANDGTEVASGNYSIGAEDKSVTLQFSADNELEYDLEKNEGGYTLTAATPGDLVNISIKK